MLFDSVACLDKTGIDPFKGGTLRMTSDNFFKKNKKKFDVIFIDGLHEYPQVKKDAENALRSLKDGGWIALHDFLPKNWKEGHVPRLNVTWSGDVLKLGFDLLQSKDINFKILLIDRGVCIIKPEKVGAKIYIDNNEINSCQFQYLYDNIKTLPLVSYSEGINWIEKKADRKWS